MKGFIRKMAAAALAVAISAGAAVSASAQNCIPAPEVKVVELERLGDSAAYSGYPDYGVTVLLKNRTIKKNPLHVQSGDSAYAEFVVPSGRKLTLQKGAYIDGNMYIEKGATVSVTGGLFAVRGNLICDGTLNIGENADISLAKKSRFVVNISGTFRYNADGMFLNREAEYACFGKFSSRYLEEAYADMVAAKPLCVLAEGNNIGEFTVVTDEKTIDGYISKMRDYGYGNPGTSSSDLDFIMGNGSKIRVSMWADRISSIAGVDVLRMIKLTDEQLGRESSIN